MPIHVVFPALRTFSGTDVYTERVCSALNDYGLEARIEWLDRRYEFFPPSLRLRSPGRRADIVHANTWSAWGLRHYGKKLVVTEHHCVTDPWYSPHKSRLQAIYHQWVAHFEKLGLESADAVLVYSHFTRNALKRTFDLTPDYQIHNWIDTERYTPGPQPMQRNSTFKLLFVGNQTRRKGADLLIPLMHRLGNQFTLRMTGGRRPTSEPLPSNITQLPHLTEDELVAEYQRCDALLFPSRYEGFGYAMAEAMSCGKPVIAFDNGVADELLVHGQEGFLLPIDDLDALQEACERLAAEPLLLKSLGEAAREAAVVRFSRDRAVRQYIEMYEQVLAQ